MLLLRWFTFSCLWVFGLGQLKQTKMSVTKATGYNQLPLDGKYKKIEARKDFQTSTSNLTLNYLKKEDEATYYCALWASKYIVGQGICQRDKTRSNSLRQTH
nr:T-cell receptor gamma chain [Rattus norvegicus]